MIFRLAKDKIRVSTTDVPKEPFNLVAAHVTTNVKKDTLPCKVSFFAPLLLNATTEAGDKTGRRSFQWAGPPHPENPLLRHSYVVCRSA